MHLDICNWFTYPFVNHEVLFIIMYIYNFLWNYMSYVIYVDYFEGIFLYLHLIAKKMEVANEPTQIIHITITRHRVPK